MLSQLDSTDLCCMILCIFIVWDVWIDLVQLDQDELIDVQLELGDESGPKDYFHGRYCSILDEVIYRVFSYASSSTLYPCQ